MMGSAFSMLTVFVKCAVITFIISLIYLNLVVKLDCKNPWAVNLSKISDFLFWVFFHMVCMVLKSFI